MELKTIKDLECGCLDCVKQEGIKWWKEEFGCGEDMCCTCEEMWRKFFNITEEDLK